MDGFNIIPVEKDILKPATPENVDVGIEIIDEEKEKKKQEEAAKSGSLLLILAYVTLAAVLGYLGFLIFQRVIIHRQLLFRLMILKLRLSLRKKTSLNKSSLSQR